MWFVIRARMCVEGMCILCSVFTLKWCLFIDHITEIWLNVSWAFESSVGSYYCCFNSVRSWWMCHFSDEYKPCPIIIIMPTLTCLWSFCYYLWSKGWRDWDRTLISIRARFSENASLLGNPWRNRVYTLYTFNTFSRFLFRAHICGTCNIIFHDLSMICRNFCSIISGSIAMWLH